MDDQTFWQIIEETHDVSMEMQEKKLFERLSELEESEIIEFERISCVRSWELYSWELWGVAYLYWGGCSDDGFMDWCDWIVHCGREVFETARDRPDDLVPVIDTHPAAGCEGIGYVPIRVLRAKNPDWEDTSPDFEISTPDEPRGEKWEEEDLERLLPKTYQRFERDATEEERLMKDPDYVMEAFGVTLGEEQVFTMDSEEVEIGGQPATRRRLVPVKGSMKTCEECGSVAPSRLSVCPDCEAILEESHYLRIVMVCAALGLLVTFCLQRMGHEGRGLVPEAFMTATALMIVTAVGWKVLQRLGDNARNPLRELVALYSDRTGRVVILSVAVAMLLTESGVVSVSLFAADSEASPIRAVRAVIILGFTAIYAPALIYFMRLGFVDLRRPNGLREYERRKFGIGG